MAQLVDLEGKSESKGNRVPLDEALATHAIRALSDAVSRKILSSSVTSGKTVTEMSAENAIPLSSCHRKTRELLDHGLLVVERIVLTPGGTKYAVYRSSFKRLELSSDFEEASVFVELNGVTVERLRGNRQGVYPREGIQAHAL